MTAPSSLTGITNGSFSGVLSPADVAKVVNLLADGAPFANSLTRQPTSRATVAFPVASPDGFGWVGELEAIPEVTLNDSAVIVAVAKLAGILDLSNESVYDSTVNLTTEIGQLLADGMSPQLDAGLLYGSGANNEPAGVVAAAPNIDAADLLTGIAAAIGAIGDSGGHPDTVAASATTLANAALATTNTGELMYPSGFGAAVGLIPVAVPGLTTPLVYDSKRLFLIVNGQLSDVAFSKDYHFAYDATSVRVKARVAVGLPAPLKAIRKLTIPAGGALGVQATKSSTTAKAK